MLDCVWPSAIHSTICYGEKSKNRPKDKTRIRILTNHTKPWQNMLKFIKQTTTMTMLMRTKSYTEFVDVCVCTCVLSALNYMTLPGYALSVASITVIRLQMRYGVPWAKPRIYEIMSRTIDVRIFRQKLCENKRNRAVGYYLYTHTFRVQDSHARVFWYHLHSYHDLLGVSLLYSDMRNTSERPSVQASEQTESDYSDYETNAYMCFCGIYCFLFGLMLFNIELELNLSISSRSPFKWYLRMSATMQYSYHAIIVQYYYEHTHTHTL